MLKPGGQQPFGPSPGLREEAGGPCWKPKETLETRASSAPQPRDVWLRVSAALPGAGEETVDRVAAPRGSAGPWRSFLTPSPIGHLFLSRPSECLGQSQVLPDGSGIMRIPCDQD